jgi:LuxR family maltose regulon positive regulatory protein
MNTAALLSTKLRIPAARPAAVTRPRLTARLTEGLRLGRRLTLVSAPPGFGKTTLIREWAGALASSADAGAARGVAWLSVDEEDNDPVTFLRYVSATLEQAGMRAGPPSRPTASLTAPQELLIALINDLAAAGVEMLLVLDDYHTISEYAVHDLVAFLVAHLPAGCHVVIGAREDPPLPLARLRARDQLTEIRERDLRFSPEEAAVFFGETMRLSLSSAAIAALTARTEGWITGLQLAGLALRQPPWGQRSQHAADEFVAAFAGDDRYIVDYLMAEVLEREPAPIRDFLRQTSILDRLCAGLCDAVTSPLASVAPSPPDGMSKEISVQRRATSPLAPVAPSPLSSQERGEGVGGSEVRSQAILEHLERANLFVVALDNRREWYRYHILFAEALRLSLAREEQIELHRKAAGWFQTHGWGELAVRHVRLAAELSAAAGSARQPAALAQTLVEPLSEREIEVLRLIAAGLSNQEIADRLIIAPGTVKRHINNLYGKLQVGSRTQAIAAARDLQIL